MNGARATLWVYDVPTHPLCFDRANPLWFSRENPNNFSSAVVEISTDIYPLQFRDSPLDSFICYGCSQPYSGTSGLYSIDLKGNTMSVVCAHCKWWAERRITARNRKYCVP